MLNDSVNETNFNEMSYLAIGEPTWLSRLKTILFNVVVIIGFLVLVTNFYPIYASSGSMAPTIPTRSLIFARVDGGKNIQYGDIVLFVDTPPEEKIDDFGDILVQSLHGWRPWIKRVVGLPGDVIETHDDALYRNGVKVEEDYIDVRTWGRFGPYTVPDGEYFTLGDNRNRSEDSRVIGSIPEISIVGKIVLIAPSIKDYDGPILGAGEFVAPEFFPEE